MDIGTHIRTVFGYNHACIQKILGSNAFSKLAIIRYYSTSTLAVGYLIDYAHRNSVCTYCIQSITMYGTCVIVVLKTSRRLLCIQIISEIHVHARIM